MYHCLVLLVLWHFMYFLLPLKARERAELLWQEEAQLREQEQQRLREMELLHQELEALLEAERQAKHDEEIVRSMQAKYSNLVYS